MPINAELLVAIDAAFERTARGRRRWPNPHADGSPLDEEYSRVTDAAKWHILGARAEAWVIALVDQGLAAIERQAKVEWHDASGPIASKVDRMVPFAPGALPLVVAHTMLGDVEDAVGITLGIGDPAVQVALVPNCGCDACDSGSSNELDYLDEFFWDVVSGVYRRLSRDQRQITVGDGRLSSAGNFRRGETERIVENPTGWDELVGSSWLLPR